MTGVWQEPGVGPDTALNLEERSGSSCGSVPGPEPGSDTREPQGKPSGSLAFDVQPSSDGPSNGCTDGLLLAELEPRLAKRCSTGRDLREHLHDLAW